MPLINYNLVKRIILKYKIIEEKDLNRILSPEEMTLAKEADKELILKIKDSENYKKFLESCL